MLEQMVRGELPGGASLGRSVLDSGPSDHIANQNAPDRVSGPTPLPPEQRRRLQTCHGTVRVNDTVEVDTPIGPIAALALSNTQDIASMGQHRKQRRHRLGHHLFRALSRLLSGPEARLLLVSWVRRSRSTLPPLRALGLGRPSPHRSLGTLLDRSLEG